MSGTTSERLEELYRIAACVYACEGIPTEALEAGVIRDLIDAATRYLRVMTRDTDDDPNCWAEEEFAEARLREVLAKVRGTVKGREGRLGRPHRGGRVHGDRGDGGSTGRVE